MYDFDQPLTCSCPFWFLPFGQLCSTHSQWSLHFNFCFVLVMLTMLVAIRIHMICINPYPVYFCFDCFCSAICVALCKRVRRPAPVHLVWLVLMRKPFALPKRICFLHVCVCVCLPRVLLLLSKSFPAGETPDSWAWEARWNLFGSTFKSLLCRTMLCIAFRSHHVHDLLLLYFWFSTGCLFFNDAVPCEC